MKFDQSFGKYASILTLSLLVGAVAAPVLAGQSGGSLVLAADRAGDALPIGAPLGAAGGSDREARASGKSLAAFGTNRAGDALPMGAPPVVATSSDRKSVV